MFSNNSKEATVNMAKFAGSIKPRKTGFQEIIKVVITFSVLSALIMIAVR